MLGWYFRKDKKSCKAEGEPMSLIFTAEGEIRELTQKTNQLSVLFTTPMPKMTGLDATIMPRSIYFSLEQPPSLHHINLHTRKRNYIMNNEIGLPQKLAVDWATHNVYYYNAASNEKSIKICNFKDVSCVKIVDIDVHRQVSAITVDAVNKFLFYALSNWWMFNSPTFMLYKTHLDGSHNEVLIQASSGKSSV